MDLHETSDIEAGSLDGLNLADEDILDGEDFGGSALDLVTNGFGDELLDETLQVSGGGLGSHGVNHQLADSTDVRSLGVSSLGDRESSDGSLLSVSSALGEANAEETEVVAVSGLDINKGLNDGLLLSDQAVELVASHVHTIEVGEELSSRDFLTDQLDLTEGNILRLVLGEVSQRSGDDTALDNLSGNLCRSSYKLVGGLQGGTATKLLTGTSGTGNRGQTDETLGEDTRSLDLVPFLLGEGVDTTVR